MDADLFNKIVKHRGGELCYVAVLSDQIDPYLCVLFGELGADLDLTETFLSIGVDELSVSPRSVLPLRQKVRETELGAVRQKLVDELMGDR